MKIRDGHVGLFGGSFDPIHFGHLIVAERAREALDLEVLWLVPSGIPPHKEALGLAPARDRLAMARLAVRGNPGLGVLDLEVRRTRTSYTIDTVREIRSQVGPGGEIDFLLGFDSVADLPSWREIEALFGECRLVPVRRPGHDLSVLDGLEGRLSRARIRMLRRNLLDTPRIEISSSEIRSRVRQGRGIRYLLPDAVRRYIVRRGLYGAAAAPRFSG